MLQSCDNRAGKRKDIRTALAVRFMRRNVLDAERAWGPERDRSSGHTSEGKSSTFYCGTNETVPVRKPSSTKHWVEQGHVLTRSSAITTSLASAPSHLSTL